MHPAKKWTLTTTLSKVIPSLIKEKEKIENIFFKRIQNVGSKKMV